MSTLFDIHYNEDLRRKTVNQILSYTNLFSQYARHDCHFKKCNPQNIVRFIKDRERIHEAKFDTDVFVCRFRKVHICDNSCLSAITDSDGRKKCIISFKTKDHFVASLILNKKDERTHQNATMLQDETEYDNHRHIHKIREFSRKIDEYYNWIINNDDGRSEQDMRRFEDGSFDSSQQFWEPTGSYIRHRSRNLNTKQLYNLPTDFEVIDICLKRKWINTYERKGEKILINLESIALWNEVTYMLQDTKKIAQTSLYNNRGWFSSGYGNGGVLNTRKTTGPVNLNVMTAWENLIRRILPGIHRIRCNFFEIQSIQTKLYSNGMHYLNNCTREKKLANNWKLFSLVNFDIEWEKHNIRIRLDMWPKIHEYGRYLTLGRKMFNRLHSFVSKLREDQAKKNKRKTTPNDPTPSPRVMFVDPMTFILGFMYLLKEGYKYKGTTVIPVDKYLNKNGVLLDKKDLSKYVNPKSRNAHKVGLSRIKEILDKLMKIVPPIDFMDLIFKEN